jgi:capsular polysaccharide transport system ATP-binding protein
VISIENLSKVYHTRRGPYVVLDEVDLQVEKGEKWGVIGRNGAGKSTLIRLIGGAEYPTSGRIKREMTVSWPLAFGGAFHGNLTGFDNVRFICRVYGIEYRSVLPFVEEFTELGVFLREPVDHYSSGMRARLAFALSLAVEFDCYLVDEVIVVGDTRFHEKCNVELFEKRADRALILVTHDAKLITERCNRFCVLESKNLLQFESAECAYDHYESRGR